MFCKVLRNLFEQKLVELEQIKDKKRELFNRNKWKEADTKSSEENDDDINEEELVKTINKIKNTAGHDPITPEMIKCLGKYGRILLLKIVIVAWNRAKIPKNCNNLQMIQFRPHLRLLVTRYCIHRKVPQYRFLWYAATHLTMVSLFKVLLIITNCALADLTSVTGTGQALLYKFQYYAKQSSSCMWSTSVCNIYELHIEKVLYCQTRCMFCLIVLLLHFQ